MCAMIPVLIGYFPKRTERQPDWLKAPNVEEICSVSDCVSSGPEDWIEAWRHNEMWVFDTPELAWSIVPPAEREAFDLYAYFLFPVRFTDGKREPFVIPPVSPQPLSGDFERLGYDVVSRSTDACWEHSPLSCNHMAEEIAVNRHCLIDDAETALRLPEEFEKRHCEPGPYLIVEVWRWRERARSR
jgi:hypothetical protein